MYNVIVQCTMSFNLIHFNFLELSRKIIYQIQNLIQSCSNICKAKMSNNYVEPKTVLGSVKIGTWKFFKFRVQILTKAMCIASSALMQERKRGDIKYCGGTTNMTNHLKAHHKTDYKSLDNCQLIGPSLIVLVRWFEINRQLMN